LICWNCWRLNNMMLNIYLYIYIYIGGSIVVCVER